MVVIRTLPRSGPVRSRLCPSPNRFSLQVRSALSLCLPMYQPQMLVKLCLQRLLYSSRSGRCPEPLALNVTFIQPVQYAST